MGSLWRGTLPSVIRTGLGSALYFSTLNTLRQHLLRSNVYTPTRPAKGGQGDDGGTSSSSLPRLNHVANLTSGAIARALAGFVMMPVTVIKVRYESNLYSYPSIWGAGTAIVRSEGLRGLFSGFGATAIRDAPYAGLYILIYEQSKLQMSRVRSAKTLDEKLGLHAEMNLARSASINFVSGVLAAAIATAVTNPFDAIKTRLQLMPGEYGNMLTTGIRMVSEDGPRSLFAGLGLRMGRKAMSSALAWTLYEEMVRKAEGKIGNNV